MSGYNYQRVIQFFQKADAQARIRQRIQHGRTRAMVPISSAAAIFNFTENQLRDWETRGLLKPMRKDEKGRRLYPIGELDKLAIIREMLNASFMPGDIPVDVDRIWNDVVPFDESLDEVDAQDDAYRYILRRAEASYRKQLFWRYYASRVLLLSLMLLYKDALNTYAGLMLLFEKEARITDLQNLAIAGKSLVGWLGQTRTFFAFLAPGLAFDVPEAFDLENISIVRSDDVASSALVMVPRGKSEQLDLSEQNVEVVRRLLMPLFEDRQEWEGYFGYGMQDMVLPSMDLTSKVHDALLNGIADMIVRLGGKTEEGSARWSLSYIMLPEDSQLPMPQRKLVVRATSEACQELLGFKIRHYNKSLSLRAFIGNHIISRSGLAPDDGSITHNPVEQESGKIRSNIAVPIGGEKETPLGVLYVASHLAAGFTDEDQRVLRLMARVMEEILQTYHAHQKLISGLADVMREPGVVDISLREFSTEDNFIRDVEHILGDVSTAEQEGLDVSFIGVEVNKQDVIAACYGDQTLRNLSLAVSYRVKQSLQTLFTDYKNYELYYIGLGRYYLLLRGVTLEKTREQAIRLCRTLSDNVSLEQSDLPGSTLQLPITVHLSVNWYSYQKLREFLDPDAQRSIGDISATIFQTIDSVLQLGANKEGNAVYCWDPELRTFAPFTVEQ